MVGPVEVPVVEIEGCARSHAVLLEAVGGLTDDEARRPSLLPDWTVGHVLTHLARNADSVVHRLEGAARGEVLDQYVGGAAGRADAIEAGATRSAAELLADLRSSAAAVDDLLPRLPAVTWGRPTRTVSGLEQPAAQVVSTRWREVELHHVDLGLGYLPDRWPPDLVSACLPALLGGLPGRTDPGTLLAWLVGRGPAPVPGPWS